MYYYHGVSHHLGLDTHDVSDRERPLEPGMVITVEPGLYFKEHSIGIRIEDDVLVTNTGSENLSIDIPKEIHDIEKLMSTVMTNLKDMVDVNTIIGSPIVVNNMTIVPVSKVTFGFAAGGSEFNSETLDEYARSEQDEEILYKLPFGGGSGAGVTINPVGFLVVGNGTVKFISVDQQSATDKLVDYVPEALDKIQGMINNKKPKEKKYEGENRY